MGACCVFDCGMPWPPMGPPAPPLGPPGSAHPSPPCPMAPPCITPHLFPRPLLLPLLLQDGCTPLHLAAHSGHLPVVQALLLHPRVNPGEKDNVRGRGRSG